ncbi:MAG: biopolymer transporter ExbD [Cyanobacteria bacterium CRU_2_1]|nr:biopolymer transporter ExbD [Cyanobacteria bacterium RU_5_0]NJR58928.1 biopolymer transporter ExbD [Cyanobacteria bacterium CRU_2_1]
MRLLDDSEPPFQINIVPMIDVIFAILTFFIMSTLFLNRSEGLPVNLPNATTSETQSQQDQIVVTIDPQGNLSFNRQPIQLDALVAQVRSLASSGQQPLVVINADETVTHGRVITVMDRLKAIPGVRLAIATKRP